MKQYPLSSKNSHAVIFSLGVLELLYKEASRKRKDGDSRK